MVGFGILTEWAGYSIVVGGFFAGLGLGEGLGEVERQKLVRWLNPLTKVFVPFYFVLVGLRAELGVLEDTKTWELLFGVLVAAFVGKILSGALVSVKVSGLCYCLFDVSIRFVFILILVCILNPAE